MPAKRQPPKPRNKGILEFLLTKSRKCAPHRDKRRKVQEREIRNSLEDPKRDDSPA